MDTSTKFGIFLAMLGLGVTLAAAFAPYEWPKMSRLIRRTGLGLGFFLIVGSFACLLVLPDEEKPEVTLRFVHPKSPYIQLVNTSNAVAAHIKYQVAAWNLDTFAQSQNPLPVPPSEFDLLTSRNTTLPINIFETPTVAPFVSQGNRIFGSASVICPTCTRGRTFWFYIVWGKGGWYSENTDINNGNIVLPSNPAQLDEFAKRIIGKIPFHAREQIEGLP